MSNDGVHETHCCVEHGCKYGDNDCPVKEGRITQRYPCEYCAMDKEEMERTLHEIFDFGMQNAATRAFYEGLKARGLKVVKIDD